MDLSNKEKFFIKFSKSVQIVNGNLELLCQGKDNLSATQIEETQVEFHKVISFFHFLLDEKSSSNKENTFFQILSLKRIKKYLSTYYPFFIISIEQRYEKQEMYINTKLLSSIFSIIHNYFKSHFQKIQNVPLSLEVNEGRNTVHFIITPFFIEEQSFFHSSYLPFLKYLTSLHQSVLRYTNDNKLELIFSTDIENITTKLQLVFIGDYQPAENILSAINEKNEISDISIVSLDKKTSSKDKLSKLKESIFLIELNSTNIADLGTEIKQFQEAIAEHNTIVFIFPEIQKIEDITTKYNILFYLIKPIKTKHLENVLSYIVKTRKRIKLLNTSLSFAQQTLDIDQVTGINNRRFYDQKISEFINKKKRFSLIVFDIDFFKVFNDQHGHQMGDFILKKIAQTLKQQVRKTDIVARYGGEEFVALLPDTLYNEAFKIAEKVRIAVEEKYFKLQEFQPNKNLTISAGVASYPESNQNVDELFAIADKYLYIAKNEGKNQTRGPKIINSVK